ncbi:amino acid permease [Blastococcus sp. TF02A-26]|uniref:amino acid permease n=1 Tax=Blastococcus sp. TF02A-26 TaxID=2250577 RepID=UPI000DE8A3EA|nr:amino acid permease [Blastococcus sp. TF02A-26]RBY80792.1 amino acid permease [Blastococcus sp. TF02A-26]
MSTTSPAVEPDSAAPGEHRFGLPTATALVVGSVIGTGVFALPSALAAYGPVSLVAFVVVTVGALALALTFGSLSRRLPGSGGPYVYARDAFGDFAGFLNAWSYWITAWAGNAAIAVAWVGYVEVFVNEGHATGWSIAIALAGLWIPAVVNLSGLRNTGALQVVTTVLKFIPLLFMATVGLLFVESGNFGEFNASGMSVGGAISAAAAIALFSYLGIEAASVAAGRVRDPRRNVGRATVLGTLACAAVYILGTLAVFGTVSNADLQASTAPFTDSANAIFGGEWAGQVVAVAAVVSGLGALIGWTLIVAEMPKAAAEDRLFPRQFATTRRGVPAFAVVVSTLLASVLVVVSYTSFSNVFTTVVLLTVLTAVIPYLFSAAAQLYWLATHGRATRWPHLVRDVVISVLALGFSFWALAGSGYQAVYYGVFGFFLGVPVYVWLKVQRREYGEPGRAEVAVAPPVLPPADAAVVQVTGVLLPEQRQTTNGSSAAAAPTRVS